MTSKLTTEVVEVRLVVTIAAVLTPCRGAYPQSTRLDFGHPEMVVFPLASVFDPELYC